MEMQQSSVLDINRFIKDDPAYEPLNTFYYYHQKMLWRADEVKATNDLDDWKTKLDDSERHFIKRILSFFAVADGMVGENLFNNFMNEAKNVRPAMNFYKVQCQIEAIHEEVYKSFIHAYFVNEDEKQKVFDDIKNCRAIRQKVKFVQRWMNSSLPFEQRLVAFAVIEGLLFSSSFCAIYWLKSRGLLHQLTLSNEWISRDENIHTVFACEFFKILQTKLDKPLPEKLVREIIIDGVNTELTFVEEAFKTFSNKETLTPEMMSQYVRCVANDLLRSLGFTNSVPLYDDSTHKCDWMTLMALDGKTNFFERVVSEYKQVSIPDYDEAKKIIDSV